MTYMKKKEKKSPPPQETTESKKEVVEQLPREHKEMITKKDLLYSFVMIVLTALVIFLDYLFPSDYGLYIGFAVVGTALSIIMGYGMGQKHKRL